MPRRRKSRSRSRDRKPNRGHHREETKRPNKSSDADRQKKLQEMMENAKWREEQRTKNVKHYKAMDEKEERERVEKHDPDFIRKQLERAAATGSVEKRIQANKHNIQRGHSSMDSNFARR